MFTNESTSTNPNLKLSHQIAKIVPFIYLVHQILGFRFTVEFIRIDLICFLIMNCRHKTFMFAVNVKPHIELLDGDSFIRRSEISNCLCLLNTI